MRHAVLAAAFLAAVCLIVAGCSLGGETPSVILVTPSAGPTTAPTASSATATPTVVATATPNPGTLIPAATPTPVPVRHQYLLYRTGIDITDGYRPQIWVVKPDGTGNHKIADGPDEPMVSPPTHDIVATWSHDGSVVHVVKYTTGTSQATYCLPQITNLSIGSGASHAVAATLTNHDDNFVWSPDETKIVFRHWVVQPNCVQNDTDPRTDLVMMNADGTGRHTITSNVSYVISAWTSDGTSLIGHSTVTYGQAVRVNPTTGNATAIGPSTANWPPAVSPDGTGIAFVVSGKLHVVNSNGSGAIDLSVPSATDYGPVWSADGTALALRRTIGTTTRIIVIRLPSPTATVLATTGAADYTEFPCWEPNGARVAFSMNAGPLMVANSNGTGAWPVPGVTDVRLLSWQP